MLLELTGWLRKVTFGNKERAVLAGGCFWGVQDLIRRLPGVISTRVGYSGGDVPNATYRNHGTHAEAIEIVFDPAQDSYRDLLEFFFQIHDPTTKNRQGNDVGAELPVGDLLHRRRAAQSPRTRSPTSTPRASGRARWSPRSSRPARSGRPSRSTRTTCSATPTGTPATSPGRTGSCPAARTRCSAPSRSGCALHPADRPSHRRRPRHDPPAPCRVGAACAGGLPNFSWSGGRAACGVCDDVATQVPS